MFTRRRWIVGVKESGKPTIWYGPFRKEKKAYNYGIAQAPIQFAGIPFVVTELKKP